ncbi:hypothetical protein J5U18_11665 [Sphingobacteriaceae bacterium WQ 2009]|uniref:Uncharacterized protein n=1 Tax=Rhinopithecimicrobium faecis TaxID=2820698 RepID=A0A8T4HB14_9SPHI|nr:hypothetical protein [Sphingobacteriaceae bacterium WQ 2009]
MFLFIALCALCSASYLCTRTWCLAISLTDSLRSTIPATYILTVDAGKNKEQDDFYPFYLRALNKKFKVQIMEADHNPQIKHMAALVNLLQEEK